LHIRDLAYDRNTKKFIIQQNVLDIENYITNYLISTKKKEPTRIIENSTYIINSLDECYSHALIDRIFPYFWSIRNITGYNEHAITIFIKEDKLKKFPIRKRIINNETGKYKNAWNNLINLLNPKEIVFEHLLKPDDVLLFKNSYLYAENNKLCKWQRTFWNCNKNYSGGRGIKNVLYNDIKIKFELDIFINMVKTKYNIKDKQNNVQNVVIIDRISNRKFDSNLLQTLDKFCKNVSRIHYNGIQFLEKLSFDEQIKLFNINDIILFRHGSCLANILWVKKGTIIIELDHISNRPIVIKRICNFTASVPLRYSYNKIVENNNILLDKMIEVIHNI